MLTAVIRLAYRRDVELVGILGLRILVGSTRDVSRHVATNAGANVEKSLHHLLFVISLQINRSILVIVESD